jgi:hypothetical protein
MKTVILMAVAVLVMSCGGEIQDQSGAAQASQEPAQAESASNESSLICLGGLGCSPAAPPYCVDGNKYQVFRCTDCNFHSSYTSRWIGYCISLGF